jgi:hypothetical protein
MRNDVKDREVNSKGIAFEVKFKVSYSFNGRFCFGDTLPGGFDAARSRRKKDISVVGHYYVRLIMSGSNKNLPRSKYQPLDALQQHSSRALQLRESCIAVGKNAINHCN